MELMVRQVQQVRPERPERSAPQVHQCSLLAPTAQLALTPPAMQLSISDLPTFPCPGRQPEHRESMPIGRCLLLRVSRAQRVRQVPMEPTVLTARPVHQARTVPMAQRVRLVLPALTELMVRLVLPALTVLTVRPGLWVRLVRLVHRSTSLGFGRVVRHIQ